MKNVVESRTGHRAGEKSFTILETLVAMGILLTVVLEVVGTQGNITSLATYSRRLTEATWLAKRIMSQVEYQWHQKDFKDLETTLNDQKFNLDPSEGSEEFDYTYNLTIEEWKLPIFDILSSGGPKTAEEQEEEKESNTLQNEGNPLGGAIPGLDQIITTIFQDHVLKIAHLEVFWPEGARRNSVTLTYLLTNQKALDEYVLTKDKVFDKLQKAVESDITGRSGGGRNPPDRNNPNPPDGGNRNPPDTDRPDPNAEDEL